MKAILKKSIFLILALALASSCNNSDDDTVDISVPVTINTITPNMGEAGTLLTITGNGFDAVTISNNKVSFNGTIATVAIATETELQVSVPVGATTGPVSITLNGETSQGPTFTYDERLKFEGDYENDDYSIRYYVPGYIDETLPVNKTSEVEIKLVNGSSDEIEVDIRDLLEEGLINALGGSPGALIFTFDDDINAEIDGNEFEIEPFNFTLSDGSNTYAASFEEGEGEFEDGVITFSYEYNFTDGTDTGYISAQDIELELQ